MNAIRIAVLWALLVAGAVFGLAVVGTASLMVGDGVAIRNGLLMWLVVTVLSFVGMHFALKRQSVLASVGVVPVPVLAAFFSTHYVMGA